jgi:hypothetical protein
LAGRHFESGRSCDRPTRSRFSLVFLGPRANAELVPKFPVALHASHAALPMVTLKISPCTNVTLTFDFDFGLDHSVHGWRPGTKTNWLTDHRSQYTSNLKLNLRHCTANYRAVLSSERAPYMKKQKEVIVTQINVASGHPLQKGHDTKTNWPQLPKTSRNGYQK